MKIYRHEQSIKNKILANCTASCIVATQICKDLDLDQKLARQLTRLSNKNMADIFKKVGAALDQGAHPDMLYGSAILVSSVMNLNDDVFLAGDIWAARNTIYNTPYNDMHEQENIIGHIFDRRIIDQDGNEIDEASVEIPDLIHVEVSFAMYKFIFPELAAEIEDGFENSTAFVSMECFLGDFCYALIDNQDNVKIIARNDETSFLTKHLRCYGGTGQYEDYRIGRVLKNIRFVGMGNVDTPANPDSKYTQIKNLTQANASDFKNCLYNTSEANNCSYLVRGKIMKIENVEQAEQIIEDLQAKLDELKSGQTQAELDKANADNQKLQEALDATNEQLEKATKDQEAQIKDLETAKVTIEEIQAKLDKIEAEKLVAERMAKLAEAGITLEKDEMEDVQSMDEKSFQFILKHSKPTAEEPNETLEDAKADEDVVADIVNADEDEDEENEVIATAAKLASVLTKKNK